MCYDSSKIEFTFTSELAMHRREGSNKVSCTQYTGRTKRNRIFLREKKRRKNFCEDSIRVVINSEFTSFFLLGFTGFSESMSAAQLSVYSEGLRETLHHYYCLYLIVKNRGVPHSWTLENVVVVVVRVRLGAWDMEHGASTAPNTRRTM